MQQKFDRMISDAAEKARNGLTSRRDFFRYAACFGVSAMAAKQMLGTKGTDAVPSVAGAARPAKGTPDGGDA